MNCLICDYIVKYGNIVDGKIICATCMKESTSQLKCDLETEKYTKVVVRKWSELYPLIKDDLLCKYYTDTLKFMGKIKSLEELREHIDKIIAVQKPCDGCCKVPSRYYSNNLPNCGNKRQLLTGLKSMICLIFNEFDVYTNYFTLPTHDHHQYYNGSNQMYKHPHNIYSKELDALIVDYGVRMNSKEALHRVGKYKEAAKLNYYPSMLKAAPLEPSAERQIEMFENAIDIMVNKGVSDNETLRAKFEMAKRIVNREIIYIELMVSGYTPTIMDIYKWLKANKLLIKHASKLKTLIYKLCPVDQFKINDMPNHIKQYHNILLELN